MAIFDKKKLQKIKEMELKEQKHTIMIVDDEEAHLSSMESMLSEDYYIITAKDGQEALDMINKMKNPGSISLIISDQRMPKLTGIELFEKLLPILPKTIRMILTGYIDIPVIIDAVNKTQIYQFIQKPFEPEDLKLRIKRAVEAFESKKKEEEYCQTLEERNKELEQKNKELEEAKRKLEESNLLDPLTGLRNRRYIENFIQNDISKVQRDYTSPLLDNKKPITPASDIIFLILDIDNLKSVNSLYNHKAGDVALKELTKVLQRVCRKSDTLVRWGNDEFLIVICFTDRQQADRQAERLRQAVEKHRFDLGDGQSARLTCSIGFAAYPFLIKHPEALNWDQVMTIVEQALSMAQKSGGNTWIGIKGTDNSKIDNFYQRIRKEIRSMIVNGEISISNSIPDENFVVRIY